MRPKLYHALIVAVWIAGCGRASRLVPYDLDPRGGGVYPGQRESVAEKRGSHYPWEVWPLELDLKGHPLRREEIVRGDMYLKQGNRSKALAAYLSVKQEPLQPAEQDALVLRIASTQLALGDSERALGTISDHFRRHNLGVEDVDARLSLVLGYGYLRTNNSDQSLAWFSRVARLGGGPDNLGEAGRYGIRRILESIPAQEFDRVDRIWTNDSLVSQLLGRERRRRASGGSAMAINRVEDLLIEDLGSEVAVSDGRQAGLREAVPSSSSVVGVLLPLTGEYASLGQSTKNGIDMAMTQEPGGLSVVYKDSGASAEQAYAKAEELVTADGAAVVLGPLLSEHAAAVSDAARQDGFPIVTFSKKESFSTGNGIFRLGATASSQVKSLLDICSGKLGMRKFALIYPSDQNGLEFAQSFKNEVRIRNGELVYESSFSKNDPNALVTIAGEVESYGPDGIFFPDSLTSAGRFFSLMSPESLRRTKPIGPASWDNQTELVQSQNVMEGAVFVSPFFAQSSKPTISRFVETYRTKYGQAPNFLAAQGFDAATMVAAALKQGSEDGVPFSEALQSIEVYDGLTGMIRVESDGEIDRTYSVVQFKRGAVRELGDGTPEAGRAGMGHDPAAYEDSAQDNPGR